MPDLRVSITFARVFQRGDAKLPSLPRQRLNTAVVPAQAGPMHTAAGDARDVTNSRLQPSQPKPSVFMGPRLRGDDLERVARHSGVPGAMQPDSVMRALVRLRPGNTFTANVRASRFANVARNRACWSSPEFDREPRDCAPQPCVVMGASLLGSRAHLSGASPCRGMREKR